MNKELLIEEKEVYEYVRDTLNSLKYGIVNIENSKDIFHHTSSYSNVITILKYGILSLSDLRKKDLISITDDEFKKLSNYDSHSNGVDGVSFAKVKEKDPYYENQDMFYYDPVNCLNHVDILYSINDRSNYRTGFDCNYYNEYVFTRSFPSDMIKSLDTRIMKLLINKPNKVHDVILYLNYLKEYVVFLQNNHLDIPIRDMSYEKSNDCVKGNLLDNNKIMNMPKVLIKK